MGVRDNIAREIRRITDPDTGKKVTRQQLAKVARCSEKTVERWFLRGASNMPDAEQLRRIALHFGVSADTLLGLPPINRPESGPLRLGIGQEVLARLQAVAPHIAAALGAKGETALGEAVLRRFVQEARALEDGEAEASRATLLFVSAQQAVGAESHPVVALAARLEEAARRRAEQARARVLGR